MSFKQVSLVLMVLLAAVFVSQLPKPALGSGKSTPEIIMNEDYRLALNDAAFKNLTKLEKKLKSTEKKLQKTKDQMAALRKAKK